MNWLQKLENSMRSDGSLERLVKSRTWEINELCEKYGVDTSEVFMLVRELDSCDHFVVCVKHVLDDLSEFPIIESDHESELRPFYYAKEDDYYDNVHMKTFTTVNHGLLLNGDYLNLLNKVCRGMSDNGQKLKQSSPCGKFDYPRSVSSNFRFLGEYGVADNDAVETDD